MSSEYLKKDRRYCTWSVIAYVLLTYAFYPTFHLTVSAIPTTLYQFLTEGFLAGHLSLVAPPSPELLQVANPYDPLQSKGLRLHDASLYHGKYYLYFGPLPVLAFYLPFKLLTGLYPSDGFALFFFLALGFVLCFRLLIKIQQRYFPQISGLQLVFAGLLLGIASGAPSLFSTPRVYDVAIGSAFCFISFALVFLYKSIHEDKTSNLVFLSLFSSLSVAGRPHFVFICGFLLLAVLIYKFNKNQKITLIASLFIPAACVGFLLALYNYLRFGSIFDFGHLWQLSCVDLRLIHEELAEPGKTLRNIVYGFYFYFLQPFQIRGTVFPQFGLRMHSCPYDAGGDYFIEGIAGLLTTTPFILILLALPKLLKSYIKNNPAGKPLGWLLLFTAIVPGTALFFLLILPFAVQRYQFDFMPYCCLLSILGFWIYQEQACHWRWFKLIKTLFIASAIFSIYMNLVLGLAYWIFV